MATAHGWEKLIAGDLRVLSFLQRWLDTASAGGRDVYILWGTYHDAGGQVRAFDELVGPAGLRGLTHVVLEQFRATGAWGGMSLEQQRGDGTELEAYIRHGDLSAFDTLAGRQRTEDYAAWKFGYIPSVLGVLVTARATGTRLVGCDMPEALQSATALVRGSDELNGLRELHCSLSLNDASAATKVQKPWRVAMLWGLNHTRDGGFKRWLPAEAAVMAIQVWGHRLWQGSAEAALAQKLVVNDPILIPAGTGGDKVALLLPDAVLGGDVDRVRSESEPHAVESLHVESTASGTMSVSGQSKRIGPQGGTVSLPAGEHTYSFEVQGLRFVGSVRIARRGRVDLSFDPGRRATRVVAHVPAASGDRGTSHVKPHDEPL